MSRITQKTVVLARVKQAADWLFQNTLFLARDRVTRSEQHAAMFHLGRLARRLEFGSVHPHRAAPRQRRSD